MTLKQTFKTFVTLVLTLCLLGACANSSKEEGKKKASSPSSSLQTTSEKKEGTKQDQQATSEASSTSSQSSSAESATTKIAPVDTGAVLKADYTTMAGTWTNQAGQNLTFNKQGLTTSGMTVSLLDIDQNGILLLNVETGTKTNLTLYLVPAGRALSSQYFAEGQTDTSDQSRDRIISSEDISKGQLANQTYYHLSGN